MVREGGLVLAATLYDQAGQLLAEVQDNRLNAVGNVCVRRPDLSTFLVQDFRRTELLYVHYLNPHAIEVRGSFAYPATTPVRVSRDEVNIGGWHMEGSLLAYSCHFSIIPK